MTRSHGGTVADRLGFAIPIPVPSHPITLMAGPFLRLLVLAGACLLLGGCVWLHLLSVKDQLREFDRYVETAGEPGLELRFREPVLTGDDLDQLLLGRPTLLLGDPGTGAEVRTYRFRKLPTSAAEPAGAAIDLTVICRLEDDRLTTLAFPPEVFRAIPRELAIAGLKALGRAAVDRTRRSASSSVTEAALAGILPLRSELIAVFGNPNRIDRQGGQDRLLWSYRLQGASLREDGRPVGGTLGFTFRSEPGSADGLWIDQGDARETPEWTVQLPDQRPFRLQLSLGGLWGYLELPAAGAASAAGTTSGAGTATGASGAETFSVGP